MVDTESAAQRLIHRDSGAISAVAVSADGARVVYASGQPEWDIEEFAMDGTRRRAVAASSNMDRFASWAPRGDRFVFFVGGPGVPRRIWTADAERGEAQQLITLAAGSLATAYHFSPDGGRIAYLDLNGINTLSSAGGRPVQVFASTQLGSRALLVARWRMDLVHRGGRHAAKSAEPGRAADDRARTRSALSWIAHRMAGGSPEPDLPATS